MVRRRPRVGVCDRARKAERARAARSARANPTSPAAPAAHPAAPAPPPPHLIAMESVFPEALKPLAEYDPEVYGILEDEKKRQWCVGWGGGGRRRATRLPAR